MRSTLIDSMNTRDACRPASVLDGSHCCVVGSSLLVASCRSACPGCPRLVEHVVQASANHTGAMSAGSYVVFTGSGVESVRPVDEQEKTDQITQQVRVGAARRGIGNSQRRAVR